jgi:hypothetical protein
MMGVVLDHFGFGLRQVVVEDAVFGRYSGAPGDSNVETAGWFSGHVGNVKLRVYVGKAVGERYYGIRVHGSEGDIEVFVGTETHDPYFVFAPKDGLPEIQHFVGGGLGYQSIILDLLVAGLGRPVYGIPFPVRLTSTLGSIGVIDQAYKKAGSMIEYVAGTSLPVAKPVVCNINPAIPQNAIRGMWDK